MNVTWSQNEFNGPPNHRLLDRLVDGSLPDGERRKLLLQLESETDGWRRCALAFLEAQTWREAFAPLAATSQAQPPAATTPRVPMVKPWRTVARWASVAVCVMAAFAMGWASKPAGPSESQLVLAKTKSAPDTIPSEAHAEANFAPELRPPATDWTSPNAALEAVVRSWEQQGYSAERQKTLITVKLRDGSELEVPAQEIKLRFTGDHTY